MAGKERDPPLEFGSKVEMASEAIKKRVLSDSCSKKGIGYLTILLPSQREIERIPISKPQELVRSDVLVPVAEIRGWNKREFH